MKQKYPFDLAPPEKALSENPPMLLNEIARLCAEKMRRTAPPGDGVLSQHGGRLVMMALCRAEREGRDPLSQRDLVAATHLRAPTVSGILHKMEEEGLARRETDSRDARFFRIFLTEAGRAADRAARGRVRATDEILMRGFSAEESAALRDLLLRMRQNILDDLREKEQ